MIAVECVDLSRKTIAQLKEILSALNLRTSGAKGELISRLEQCDASDVRRVVEMLQTDGEEELVYDEPRAVGKDADAIEVMRADIKGLQRNMDTLMQQLQTIISSTTLQREAVMQQNVPENVEARELASEQTELTSSTHALNQRVSLNSPNSPAGRATTTAASNSQNYELSTQAGRPINIDNWAMPQPRIRDMTEIMPDFDPCVGEITSKQFIDRIEQLKHAYGWSESLVLIAVQNKLKGAAKSWVDAHPVFTTWKDFVSSFLVDFPCIINAADLHMKMMQTRMLKGESLVEFYYKMLSIGRCGKLDDQSVIKYVINGLNDEGLRKSLTAMQFAKCSDLLTTLNNLASSSKRGVNNTISVPQTSPPTHNFLKSSAVPTNQRSDNKNGSSGPICYNCRERGHLAKNCPQPQRKQRCQKCSSVNHSTETCNRSSSSSVHAIVRKLPVKQSQNITQTIDVNGMLCEALIDSGSCKSLISSACAEKCGAAITQCKVDLSGFAGGEYRCRAAISTPVTIDGCTHNCELLVVDNDKMVFDVIVGSDILSSLGRVIIENGKFRVMNNDQLEIGDSISVQEESQLKGLLNSYVHCFGENLAELGKCESMVMDISLTSPKPIVKKPYPIPFPKQKSVETIIEELLKFDIIRPSTSLYASPVVLVRKQNGEDRLCVDYRELNAITEKEPWPMPTVEGVLSTLGGKEYFTTLDLMSGYYQIGIAERSRQYTAFVTHNGHYEFNRMPFGLRNAPCCFQKMMLRLTEPVKDKVVTYVDEVIVASKTFEEGLANLQQFLNLVESAGLTLRLSKCVFMQRSVTFLGHEIDKNGIRPGLYKTLAIQKFPRPKNATEVRRFLGLTGFFRKFVQKYALIAAPLTQLTKNDVEFDWVESRERAFRTLVNILTTEPVLGVYDMHKNHQVHTDASSYGIAGILLQEEERGVFKPIMFFSRACSEAERKYHGYELEVLAVVESCQRFRMYLLGKHFTIVTDCTAVSNLKLSKPILPRISRWFLKLLEFDYTIVHRPGEAMKHVDAMSRAAVEEAVEPTDVGACVMYVKVPVDDWLVTMQKQDTKIANIFDVLNGGKKCEQFKQYSNEYTTKNNRLYRKVEDGKLLLVIPRGMRWRIVKLCHDDAGHPGVQGTLSRIGRHFWFPRARNFVKGYLKSCVDCCFSREPFKKECQLYGMEIPRFPFDVLHLDHLGPFIRSRRGFEHVLVIVDALTRYTVIFAVRSTKTKPVVDALNQLTLYFGLPRVIVTDRGTSFTSSMFASFCQDNGVQHIKVAVRTPRANGLVERINQSILAFLKASTCHAADWDLELRTLQWTINTRINTTTKFAPIDLVYDFPLRDISGNQVLAALHDDDCDISSLRQDQKRDEAIRNIEAARRVWKAKFDAKHKHPHSYKEGDLVLIHSALPATGESRKLEVKYRGPFKISKVLRFDRYVVEDIDELHKKSKKFSTIASSDKLKPWCELYPQIDDDYDDSDHEDEYDEVDNNEQLGTS